ncbi:class II D-tagatose-bisphosphate aldolase, non-catalytic subunit [Anaerorhabdus sp.]|uniref:class II D-tagatose-bisphosphate aldolase, non-catalytic subunit n=1 Tax=Anaerorhabdus sp. TaxID=1872524 RepID=UPI003FA58E4C
MAKHPLLQMIQLQKKGLPVGIYSVCSANEFVIEAALEKGKQTKSIVLIEATSNQVNQYGGYTGMKPKDFLKFVEKIAKKVNFPMNRVILGGDHLGPLTWTHLNEKEAMKEARKLIELYVLAGFTKIHIDTSMRVADDDQKAMLSTEVIARRGAELAEVAEKAFAKLQAKNPNALHPVFIVGSEVPIPGGAQEEEEGVAVTKVKDCEATIKTFNKAFLDKGLKDAWNHVIAVVVQPGVEFGDATVIEYNRKEAKKLTNSLKSYKNLVFEGHSTDYQTKIALKQMVEDGIAILKVGPGLTFAAREGIFALAKIEEELFKGTKTKTSKFIEVLEEVMLKEPGNWKKHYHGTEQQCAFKRKYSFSDRCRYYLPNEKVQAALETLITNINTAGIPYSLLSQYMPIQYTNVREGRIPCTAEALIKDRIANCMDEYLFATNQQKLG